MGPPPPTVSAAPVSAVSPAQLELLVKELQLAREGREATQLQLSAATEATAATNSTVALLHSRVLEQEKELVALRAAAAKKKDEKEETEVPYAPHYPEQNPHAERGKFQKTNEPQLFDPANIDAVWQLLWKLGERATAAGWEYKHRVAECSYLFDVVFHEEQVFPRIIERLREPDKVFKREDGVVITVEQDVVNLLACYNTTQKIYENLINKRCNLIQLKVQINEAYPGKDNALKRDTLNQILEDETYGILGGLMPANIDAAFKKVLEVYSEKTEQQRLKAAASAGAKAASTKSTSSTGGKAFLGKKVAKDSLPAAE